MTAVQSISKPEKPYPEFPLFAHARGYWCKKYKGKQYNCGAWDDPDAALERWSEIRNELQLGLIPTRKSDNTTVEDVINAYLDAKDAQVSAGDLAKRTFNGYRKECDWLVDAIGRHVPAEKLQPGHFTKLRKEFPDSWGYDTIRHKITNTKMVFKWAVEEELIPHPLNFGSVFKVPRRKRQKAERRAKPKKFFDAKEVHQLIAKADNPQLKAMILLGLNCAFLNVDCARLRIEDVKGVWLDVPRGKNEHERKAWLWPETRTAIKAARKAIKESNVKIKPDCRELVFTTCHGQMWTDEDSGYCAIGLEFTKLKTSAKLDRPGVGFASFRHVFRTVADETLDFPAARYVMGHEGDGHAMDAVYREGISDARIKKVCEYVRQWYLDGKPKKRGAK